MGEDNPVRVIDAFVDSLDLVALKFTKSKPAATGCLAYNIRRAITLVGVPKLIEAARG